MTFKSLLIKLIYLIGGLCLLVCGLVVLWLNPHWRMPSQSGAGGVSVREIPGCSRALEHGQPSSVKQTWKTGDTLHVVVVANATCGPEFAVSPSARVKDGNVELSWRWWRDPIGMFARCECARHIEFTVPNVASANPVVTIATSHR